MPKTKFFKLRSEQDGLDLALMAVYPDGEVRALVQLAHGMCEHKKRYQKFMEYLAGQGNRFFRKLCGGNVSAFANALCDSGLTKEELAQLRQLLERDAL